MYEQKRFDTIFAQYRMDNSSCTTRKETYQTLDPVWFGKPVLKIFGRKWFRRMANLEQRIKPFLRAYPELTFKR